MREVVNLCGWVTHSAGRWGSQQPRRRGLPAMLSACGVAGVGGEVSLGALGRFKGECGSPFSALSRSPFFALLHSFVSLRPRVLHVPQRRPRHVSASTRTCARPPWPPAAPSSPARKPARTRLRTELLLLQPRPPPPWRPLLPRPPRPSSPAWSPPPCGSILPSCPRSRAPPSRKDGEKEEEEPGRVRACAAFSRPHGAGRARELAHPCDPRPPVSS